MEWLTWLSHPDMARFGLAGLFLASFLAATLLPGGSEAVLLGVVALYPGQAVPALLLATLGNTLGGMTTWAMGRLLPQPAANFQTPAPLHPSTAGFAQPAGSGGAKPCFAKPRLRPRGGFLIGSLRSISPGAHPVFHVKKDGAKNGITDPARHAGYLQRWGAPVLFFAWTPVIGDVLCAAAGWLRLPWLPCLVWMALGKGARYAALLFVAA